MKHTSVDECPCPHCGVMTDRATDVVGTAGPSPGCYTICVKCVGLCIFKEDMTLRQATDEDLAKLSEKHLEQVYEYQMAALKAVVLK